MNRTFTSLYVLLVLSVLVLGWLTEQVWQRYSPQNDLNDARVDSIELLASISVGDNTEQRLESIKPLADNIGLQVKFYGADDLSATSMYARIQSGEVVAVGAAENSIVYYKKLADSPFVLSVRDDRLPPQQTALYRLLLIVFYLLIGLVVYIWVWPLTRDLKNLQASTRHVGMDGALANIDVSMSSVIYDVQNSFNTMSTRIRELLSGQKEMTHAISHELRTPLARMKFSIAALESAHPDITEALNSLSEDINEMEHLIGVFMHYATFEARSEALEFACGELEPMVHSLIESLHAPQHCSVISELKSDSVLCEWYLMEHCISNLLNNAVRYAQFEIRVSLSEDDEFYCVTVDDDGPGITAEAQEKVFEAFYRYRDPNATQNTLTHDAVDTVKFPPKKANFGLGLALVKRIMLWHGGSAEVSNSELGGAKFTLKWRKSLAS